MPLVDEGDFCNKSPRFLADGRLLGKVEDAALQYSCPLISAPPFLTHFSTSLAVKETEPGILLSKLILSWLEFARLSSEALGNELLL
jgi:hypothetical protein